MFDAPPASVPFLERWFAPDFGPGPTYVRARWLFLRGLGLIFFSAFYSLWFQIDGLIGSQGILPAASYLDALKDVAGKKAYWIAPTLYWLHPSDGMIRFSVVVGMAASIALVFDIWPRVSIAVAGIAFLSFIAAAQDFSSYQSDGMLLEAAFLSLFFAPRGLMPGLAAASPPSRAALFVLRFEWFRIYFESGLVKILSGEQQWRSLTAMDKYYENGPLPTWIGWYAQQLPHGFHAASAAVTLLVELFVAWLVFFPGRWPRLVAFLITSVLQVGIIATANYAFLNYLVLVLGILLLDDVMLGGNGLLQPAVRRPSIIAAIVLPLHILTSTVMFFVPRFPLAVAVSPARIANTFGLFAVMTRARYEIEFQGTTDGQTWTRYPFRYKPQDIHAAPGIYAPYQPRFDWNLWFAALGTLDENQWVLNTEVRLLEGSPAVLRLFARNPFEKNPPTAVRAVLWQYWFTTRRERQLTHAWWKREYQGTWAPPAVRREDGTIGIAQ